MNKKITIITLICTLFIIVSVQAATFTDYFADGDFTSNPVWNNKSGSWSASSNYLEEITTIDAGYVIYSNFTHDDNYEINYSFNLNTLDALQNFFFLWEGNYTDGNLLPHYELRIKEDGTTDFWFRAVNSTTYDLNSTETWSADTAWHDVIINRTGNNFTISLDGSVLITATNTDQETTAGDSFGMNVNDVNSPGIYFDNFTAESPGLLGISVTLNSPTNDSLNADSPMRFNSTLESLDALTLANATLYLWNSTGQIFNTTTNTSLAGTLSDVFFNVTNLTVDDYEWNVYGCQGIGGDGNCSFATSNFTFSWIPFTVDQESHNATVLETASEVFYLNVTTTSGYTVQNARLVYNSTTYANADSTNLGGGSFALEQSINIQAGTEGFALENRSFHWNVTVTEEVTGDSSSFLTSTYYQMVDELVFGLCGGTLDIALVNFTLYDEENATIIDSGTYPTTFQATFNIGADHDNKIKNYSMSNQSVDRTFFDFCTNTTNYTFFTDMEALYGAQSYADKNYFLTNASLTNNTNEIDLYLLNESNSIEFFIDVEQDLSPVTEATVTIQKYFVGEGVYKTVEIDETSSDLGEFTAYLDLDKKYKFIITKEGTVLGTITKTASCKEAPCELTLSISSEIPALYEKFQDYFAQNVLYNLSWNPNTKVVTFEFIDTTGLADYFRLKVWESLYNETSTLIIDSQLYTSSGTLTGNLSNYTDGDFRVEVYVSRSPEKIIDYLNITISELAGTFGILGLFFAFLIILTIIFGLSWNPVVLTMSVPLALTFAKLVEILSLAWTPIIIFYILAGLAIGAMSK